MISVFVQPSGNEENLGYEFGLGVKLAKSYTQSDLAGTWYSVGLETPTSSSFSSNNPFIFIDKLVVSPESDEVAATNSPNGASEFFELTLNDQGAITWADAFDKSSEDSAIAALSHNKDVTVAVEQNTDEGFNSLVISVKQLLKPTFADLMGNWTIFYAVLNKTDQLAAVKFTYYKDNIHIDSTGNISAANAEDPDNDESYSFSLSILPEGLFSIDMFYEDSSPDSPQYELWALNEGKDLLVGTYEDSKRQGYMVGVRSVEMQ